MKTSMRDFKNGFEAWKETYFEVVAWLTFMMNEDGTMAATAYINGGRHELWTLADQLTDEFEDLHEKDYIEGWVYADYFDTIDEFLASKERQHKEEITN